MTVTALTNDLNINLLNLTINEEEETKLEENKHEKEEQTEFE